MNRIGLRHWLIALAIAITAHAALLVRFQVQDTLSATNTGAQGVHIALAPKQGKPITKRVAADTAEKSETPEKETASAPKPKTETETEPTPVPKPDTTHKPKSKPKHEPETKPKQQSEPQPEPKSEPKAKPKPKPKPKLEPKSEPEPESNPKSQPQQKREVAAASSKSTTTAPRVNKTKPTDGKNRDNALTQAGKTTDRTQKTATGSVSDTPADYRSELSAALQRHKNYPRRARRLDQEGTVVLHFVMDRNGHLLDWEIRQSSGHKLLDDAVRDMIRQANPLPALPDSVSMQRLALTVPISFKLH